MKNQLDLEECEEILWSSRPVRIKILKDDRWLALIKSTVKFLMVMILGTLFVGIQAICIAVYYFFLHTIIGINLSTPTEIIRSILIGLLLFWEWLLFSGIALDRIYRLIVRYYKTRGLTDLFFCLSSKRLYIISPRIKEKGENVKYSNDEGVIRSKFVTRQGNVISLEQAGIERIKIEYIKFTKYPNCEACDVHLTCRSRGYLLKNFKLPQVDGSSLIIKVITEKMGFQQVSKSEQTAIFTRVQ